MFSGEAGALTVAAIEALAQQGGVPKVTLPLSKIVGASYVDIAVAAGVVKSKGTYPQIRTCFLSCACLWHNGLRDRTLAARRDIVEV